MTLLKAVNVFFFQWLFMRLTKCIENDNADYVKTMSWYSLQLGILPCTGWWSKYIYVFGKPKFIKLSSKKRDTFNPNL